MTETPIASLIREMSLEGIYQIIKQIQARPDVKSVIVTTSKDLDGMEQYYKNHILEAAERIREVQNEPA